jgi:glyceraldehyde-3-phosphate dehydrogenase (NADP+)
MVQKFMRKRFQMTEKKIDALFPAINKIPKQFALEGLIIQDQYLVKGELRRWNGPFCEVFSPICVRDSSGLKPLIIGSYPLLTETVSMEALHAARAAFNNGSGPWPSMKIEQRITCFEDFLSGMKGNREEIAKRIMWEIGKPYGDSLKEFDRTVTYVKDTIKALKKEEHQSQRLSRQQGIIGRMKKVPLGVALCMGPFNYPLYETFTALAPALLTGNTVICKPPRFGTLLFGPLLKIFRDSFPEGVVNVIFGKGQQIIPPIMSSGGIDMLAFIGTSVVADHLKKLHPKPHRMKITLGLEAKNPAIVLPDADLDITIKESVMGALGFNGQRCAALKIFFVHTSIVDDFLKRFSEEIGKLKCGMPWEKNVFITPLAEPGKTSYLKGLVDDALSHGAKVINDEGGAIEESFFYPALLYPAKKEMRVYHEEQFGPVIPVVPYDDVNLPLRYVIDSKYGQQASIFGRDQHIMARLVDVLAHQVSRININCKCQRTPDTFPFTGRKDSAEGVLSVSDALHAFTVPVFIAARETEQDKAMLMEITDLVDYEAQKAKA